MEIGKDFNIRFAQREDVSLILNLLIIWIFFSTCFFLPSIKIGSGVFEDDELPFLI